MSLISLGMRMKGDTSAMAAREVQKRANYHTARWLGFAEKTTISKHGLKGFWLVQEPLYTRSGAQSPSR